MPTQGWWTSGTTFVEFEDVKVPIKNLVGKENDGFRIIMHNFNHERLHFTPHTTSHTSRTHTLAHALSPTTRFTGAVGSVRNARTCLEEAVKYARLRRTFGNRLADHQVIRHKIADMAVKIESAFVCPSIPFPPQTTSSNPLTLLHNTQRRCWNK